MKGSYLNEHVETQEKEVEDFIINSMKPEMNAISSNPVRAAIIHLLVKSSDLNHTMQVEEIAKRLGKRHSVIIYHLERLLEWKIVKIVKSIRYGNTQKRVIWGLNLEYPNLIKEVYSRILKLFFTQKELEKMCSINTNARYTNKKS
jgi:DNA-binding transcriptional ArsR family regulator